MTQILFTIAVVIVVLYGAKMWSAGRSSLGRKTESKRSAAAPSRPADASEELKRCPVCGTYTVSVSPYGCDSCKGDATE